MHIFLSRWHDSSGSKVTGYVPASGIQFP